jgi:hypothetical protein
MGNREIMEKRKLNIAMTGSWVHASLHRKEADQTTASYWYARANKPVCEESLDAEWLSIANDLLQRG